MFRQENHFGDLSHYIQKNNKMKNFITIAHGLADHTHNPHRWSSLPIYYFHMALFLIGMSGPSWANGTAKHPATASTALDFIWSETFSGLPNGITADTGITAWNTSITQGTLEVRDQLLYFEGTSGGTNATWTSAEIDISNFADIRISYRLDDTDATKEPDDYVRGYYILDNGARIQFANTANNLASSITESIANLNGSTLRIEIDFRVSFSGETYTVDNLLVEGTTTSPPSTSSAWNNSGSTIHYSNGNIGIGIIAPDAELAINGRMHSREVRVDIIGWPDYVFEEDYNLPSLEEVKSYIQQKGHLIGIPSAATIETQGLPVGDIQKRLLEKIEELTLYILQNERRVRALQQVEND